MVSAIGARSFLDLGIKGESTDKDHKDWLDLLDCDWESPVPGHKPALSITIGHGTGPQIRQLVLSGMTIPHVDLDIVSGPMATTRHTLFSVRVVSGSSTSATDTFTLEYSYEVAAPAQQHFGQKPDGTAAGMIGIVRR
jgi:hypothetical protein